MKKRSPLTREKIVETALGLIERDGLESFSTRRLGDALACEAMSIYYHFPSKGELLDAVASRVVGEIALPGADEGEWIDRLRHILESYRTVAARHPHAFPLVASRRLQSTEAQ